MTGAPGMAQQPPAAMTIALEHIERTCPEWDILAELVSFDGCAILELGCGKAEMTRQIACAGSGRTVTALEVDETQHAENLRLADLPNVRFVLAGAEAIPAADDSFDVVLMFKSLHHVPPELMPRSLAQVARVLRPGGVAYISEPIFAGAFNDLIRLFHDERAVRRAAFEALAQALARGPLELVRQVFFNAPVDFEDFAAFERRLIQVTHSHHALSPALHAAVREAFGAHMTPSGAHFTVPMRVDLLRKPLSASAHGRSA